MSMPVVQQPLAGIYSQQVAAHSLPPRGSIGMVIVVMAVITILGILAGVVGRFCTGRGRDSEYDFEGWVERKCSTCIDGYLDGPESGDYVLIPMGKSAENGENKPPEDQPPCIRDSS